MLGSFIILDKMILIRSHFWIVEGKYGVILEGEEINQQMIKAPQQSMHNFISAVR